MQTATIHSIEILGHYCRALFPRECSFLHIVKASYKQGPVIASHKTVLIKSPAPAWSHLIKSPTEKSSHSASQVMFEQQYHRLNLFIHL